MIEFIVPQYSESNQPKIDLSLLDLTQQIPERDPDLAKRDWLIEMYGTRGWIDSAESYRLSGTEPMEALSQLETVCLSKSRLRDLDDEVPVYKIPDSDGNIFHYIRDTLTEDGIYFDGLRARTLRTDERLQEAIETGNDRDDSSKVGSDWGNFSLTDQPAMKNFGISNVRDTSYLVPLANIRGTKKRNAVLVYSPDALTHMANTHYNDRTDTSDFHAFHFD